MSDQAFAQPTHINTFMPRFSPGGAIGAWLGATLSGSWPAANLAFYVPVVLPFTYPVRRVFWVNGSSIGGNRDFGIYAADGTRIYSTGSTPAAGASAVQYVALGSEILLAPGRYFFALACSSVTANQGVACLSTSSSAQIAFCSATGVLQQASALPLPASAAPATVGTTLQVPLCGITNTASGF